MARYFFHTLDGECVRDELGEELADDDAARNEALVVFGELLENSGPHFWATGLFSLITINEKREVVVALTVRASKTLPDDERARGLIAE